MFEDGELNFWKMVEVTVAYPPEMLAALQKDFRATLAQLFGSEEIEKFSAIFPPEFQSLIVKATNHSLRIEKLSYLMAAAVKIRDQKLSDEIKTAFLQIVEKFGFGKSLFGAL
ncbi:MAG: hypothetical protein V1936_02635 [Patescibacteria group bacterium]